MQLIFFSLVGFLCKLQQINQKVELLLGGRRERESSSSIPIHPIQNQSNKTSIADRKENCLATNSIPWEALR